MRRTRSHRPSAKSTDMRKNHLVATTVWWTPTVRSCSRLAEPAFMMCTTAFLYSLLRQALCHKILHRDYEMRREANAK